MEVHKFLYKRHSKKVYGDALEYEFRKNNIIYSRESQFNIEYKDIILPFYYFADFVLYNQIILEIKGTQELSNSKIKQTLNNFAASKIN